jgi:hypothetical protein
MADPLTSQIETPVSARILEGFSDFLLEVDEDTAVVEEPEDEDPADGVTAPLVPEPAPPGVTDGGVGRVARRVVTPGGSPDSANILEPSADMSAIPLKPSSPHFCQVLPPSEDTIIGDSESLGLAGINVTNILFPSLLIPFA